MRTSECTDTPAAATMKPAPKQLAEINIALRGPTVSSHLPKSAADNPSTAMAIENIYPTCFALHSEPSAAGNASSGFLKTLNA